MTGVDGGWDWPEDPVDPVDPAGPELGGQELGGPGLGGDPLGGDWFAADDPPPPEPADEPVPEPADEPVPEPWPAAPDLHPYPDQPPDDLAGEPVPVFGAPEVTEHAGWADPQFPPPLDLAGLPEPVDGPPWTDAALLGDDQVPPLEPTGGATAAELLAYAALDDDPGADPWAALRAADDPATAALARFWGGSLRP